jgi:hypothetical protein
MYNKPDERQQAKFIVSTDRNCYLETDDIAEISDFLMQLVSQPFEASVNFGRHMHSFCTFSHKKSVIYPGELLLTINCVVNNFEDKNIALKDKVENVFGYTRPESTKTIRPLVHKILSDLEERYKTHLAIEDVRTVQKQREEGLIS